MSVTLEAPPSIEALTDEPDEPVESLSKEAAGVVVGSIVGTDPTVHKQVITDSERAAWDRRVAVERDIERSKEGLKFAKHGYSRKERKKIEAEEAARLELKLKAERQASGQIPLTQVKGALNNLRQNMVYRREMKRAVGDAKAFAKHMIKSREQAARERVEDFREAYKDARHERKRARIAQLVERLYPDGKRSKFDVLPMLRDPGPRRQRAPRVETIPTEPEPPTRGMTPKAPKRRITGTQSTPFKPAGSASPSKPRSIPSFLDSIDELGRMVGDDLQPPAEEVAEVDHRQPNFD